MITPEQIVWLIPLVVGAAGALGFLFAVAHSIEEEDAIAALQRRTAEVRAEYQERLRALQESAAAAAGSGALEVGEFDILPEHTGDAWSVTNKAA